MENEIIPADAVIFWVTAVQKKQIISKKHIPCCFIRSMALALVNIINITPKATNALNCR